MKLLSNHLLSAMFFLGSLFPTALFAAEAMHATATVSALKYEYGPDASAMEKERVLYTVRYRVFVTNKGTRPVRIPTAGFLNGAEAGPNYTKIALVWDLEPDEHGITTVVSEVELQPVVLRPNEMTVLRWSKTEVNLSRLDKVELTLRVTKAFAKRYDLWAGEIAVNDIIVYREDKKYEEENRRAQRVEAELRGKSKSEP